MKKRILLFPGLTLRWLAFLILLITTPLRSEVIRRNANATLTPIELNRGDTFEFRLLNGEVRKLVLHEISSDIVITNLARLKEDQSGGATLYRFGCTVSIDGHKMNMERFVGSQESFYEPYVINGMRIWFDGVNSVGAFIKDEHGGKSSESVPNKHARFAVTDMTARICPSPLFPLYKNPENYLSISDVYNGDDCWMGAYDGYELHGGLDVNLPAGTANYAPFPMDEHVLFNSLGKGDNNNRWRGHYTWPNGDRWTLQNHHILNLLIPEGTPLAAGAHYADAAGVHVDKHPHSHFVFRVKATEDASEILLDPWILLWQIFEDNRTRAGETKAIISPLRPGVAGRPIQFQGEKSRNVFAGHGKELRYYWTFGDGTTSLDTNPVHIYAAPGIYPVTLFVEDGVSRSSFTQHITIDGKRQSSPLLVLTCEDEPSFRRRPVHMLDVYGHDPRLRPNSVHFFARQSRPKPNPRLVKLSGSGSDVKISRVRYHQGKGWLNVQVEELSETRQLKLVADASGLAYGMYEASIEITCKESLNKSEWVHVKLTVPSVPPSHRETVDLKQEIIDNADQRENRFYATPYFWVAPEFKRWKEKGFRQQYLTNGGRDVPGEYARFRPDLDEGWYEVWLAEETSFDPKQRAMAGKRQYPVDDKLNPLPKFKVRIHSQNGAEERWVIPTESRLMGKFKFDEGMDGFVDILSEGSVGQVLADAIIFKKVE